jgi:hypothetical protein
MKVVILCSQNFWFIVQENIFLQLLLQFLPAEECIVKIHAATLWNVELEVVTSSQFSDRHGETGIWNTHQMQTIWFWLQLTVSSLYPSGVAAASGEM